MSVQRLFVENWHSTGGVLVLENNTKNDSPLSISLHKLEVFHIKGHICKFLSPTPPLNKVNLRDMNFSLLLYEIG